MNKENMSAQGGKTKKLAYWASVTTLGIVLGVSLQFVKAWTEPTATAPNGNVGAPINSSSIAQTKAGALVLNTAGAPSGLLVAKGNVGIGTLMPTRKLDVNGDIKTSTQVNSDLYCDQNGNNCKTAAGLGGSMTCPCGACWNVKKTYWYDSWDANVVTSYYNVELCTPDGYVKTGVDVKTGSANTSG